MAELAKWTYNAPDEAGVGIPGNGWVDGVTPLSAENLNKMQRATSAALANLANLSDYVNSVHQKIESVADIENSVKSLNTQYSSDMHIVEIAESAGRKLKITIKKK